MGYGRVGSVLRLEGAEAVLWQRLARRGPGVVGRSMGVVGRGLWVGRRGERGTCLLYGPLCNRGKRPGAPAPALPMSYFITKPYAPPTPPPPVSNE